MISDGGGEYIGNQFRRYLTDNGITQHITPPYLTEHNGIAEGANHTIMEVVRCLLFDSELGKEFWGHEALTSVHIVNGLPSRLRAHDYKTPFELWFGSHPSIGHLRTFGSTGYRHIPAVTRTNLDPSAKRWWLIGYAEDRGSGVYRLYNEEVGQVFVSRDVLFDEDVTGTGSRMRPDTNSSINEETVGNSG